MKFLARGKRGETFTTTYRGKKIVVKQERKGSKAINRIENEAFWLKRLNKHKIGPKFISFKEGRLLMAFVVGETIGDYVKKKQLPKKLVKDLLLQCRKMDKLLVNKLEMNHPYKHVIISKGRGIMIDFERCKQTEKPKNVTQFCQYLKRLGWKVERRLVKNYKESYSEKDFKKLLELFS